MNSSVTSGGLRCLRKRCVSIERECLFDLNGDPYKAMKKTSVRKKSVKQDALRSEYRFDYSKSKPNRFAAKISQGTVAIVLDPDVAAVFKSSEVVNALLRSIISAIPSSKPGPAA